MCEEGYDKGRRKRRRRRNGVGCSIGLKGGKWVGGREE